MSQEVLCWHCKAPIGTLPLRIGFRSACDACGSDLHCCKNCRHYCPGKPNECLVPGTEWVKDREKRNLCEDFSLQANPPKAPPKSGKKSFDALFKNPLD